ncbi:MAG: xanthine dehydrogenase family protein molybdopterin-binding subunit, partial [Saprospiraceae bacterium]
MTQYIGKPIKRVEDRRFITGRGRYTDDIKMVGMTHAYILRSPYAHAKILSLDISVAEKHPGVVAVFTGKDIAADGIVGVPTGWQVNFKNGDTMKEPPHQLLVTDKARHMGDGVAVVIAEDRETARDAADLIVIEYEELDAVVTPEQAIAEGAALVHGDAPNNLC